MMRVSCFSCCVGAALLLLLLLCSFDDLGDGDGNGEGEGLAAAAEEDDAPDSSISARLRFLPAIAFFCLVSLLLQCASMAETRSMEDEAADDDEEDNDELEAAGFSGTSAALQVCKAVSQFNISGINLFMSIRFAQVVSDSAIHQRERTSLGFSGTAAR